MSKANCTYLFNKPFNVLSQFTKEHPDHITLADYLQVETDVYPVGRLDKDSEGLLLLSNNKELINRVLHPSTNKFKKYFVQVEGDVKEKTLQQLAKGIELRINKKTFLTKPALIKKISEPNLPPRNPPIRFRKEIKTSWVEISITEGKKRQIRKMFAAINYPVLRLVRIEIAEFKLGKLKPGEYQKIEG
jgi:23S rRNA pseudouridine2457 synthase